MLSTMPSDLLLMLCGQRWLLPVLAGFQPRGGARFAELLGSIGLPRDSLARALDTARAQGWIIANPGHGHPLRPEWVLTASGQKVADLAGVIAERMEELGLTSPDLTRWSLPVLQALLSGADRFNQLVRQLAPASPRALSQTLQVLVANDLVGREVEDGFPPSSRYRLTERGQLLAG